MKWLEDRRARRAFQRDLRVTKLESSVGIELSHPELDLPRILVVRNPNDSLGWRPWVALGFPGDAVYGTFENGYAGSTTYAGSRDACVEKARERLYGIALARSEQPTSVSL